LQVRWILHKNFQPFFTFFLFSYLFLKKEKNKESSRGWFAGASHSVCCFICWPQYFLGKFV
jgi:hypothetical protein